MTSVLFWKPLTRFVDTDASSQGFSLSWMLVPLQKVLMAGSLKTAVLGEGV